MTVRSFNASFLVSVRFPEIAWDGFKIPLGMPMTNRLTAINSRQPLEASQYVCTSSRLGKSTRNSKAAFLPSMHRPWVSCKFAGPVNVSHTLWQFAYAVLDSTVFFSIAIFASVCINLLFGTSIRSLRSEKNWHRGRLHDRAEHAEKISEHWQSEWEESYRILLENTLKTFNQIEICWPAKAKEPVTCELQNSRDVSFWNCRELGAAPVPVHTFGVPFPLIFWCFVHLSEILEPRTKFGTSKRN